MGKYTLYEAAGVQPLKKGSHHTAMLASDRVKMPELMDGYGRSISYLRLSVTDRCDLRCQYCMSEKMSFLPKSELLSLEELDTLGAAFIMRGVTRLRITGGEPLVRKDIMSLFKRLSRHLESGALSELTLTTNGTQLERFAEELAALGVRRINVSVDSFEPDKFAHITRGGDLAKVMRGLDAAQKAGLKIKINTVMQAQENLSHIPDMIKYAHSRNMDMTLIEAMPLGQVQQDRLAQSVNLSDYKNTLRAELGLTADDYKTGGPATYYRSAVTGGRLGFITPLSHNFCSSCNRLRLTCTGQLYMCLGQEDKIDFRALLRSGGDLDAAMDKAMQLKPKAHDFLLDSAHQSPSLARHMSVTGG